MPDGSLKIQTRICSMPDNVEVDRQISQLIGACAVKSGTVTTQVFFDPITAGFPVPPAEDQYTQWEDPDFALTQNGQEASMTYETGPASYHTCLAVTGFNLAIPVTSLITSIQVKLVTRNGGNVTGRATVFLTLNNGDDIGVNGVGNSVQHVWGGSFVLTDAQDPGNWHHDNGTGPNNTISPADVNRPEFGAVVYVDAAPGALAGQPPQTFLLDYVEVTVCYRPVL